MINVERVPLIQLIVIVALQELFPGHVAVEGRIGLIAYRPPVLIALGMPQVLCCKGSCLVTGFSLADGGSSPSCEQLRSYLEHHKYDKAEYACEDKSF
ncbi:hypothetical protein D3C85_1439960 [compost metagenome]